MPESGRVPRWVWLKRLALAVASLLVSLCVTELVLTLADVGPPWWPGTSFIDSTDRRFGLDVYPDNDRGYFDVDLRDPATLQALQAKGFFALDMRARCTPYAVAFAYNSALCRGPAIEARGPGRSRVVVMGDSFAEGQGVRQEDTFAAVLDRELGDSVEVLNCGRRGYDFPHLYEWFIGHLHLDPDIVVYAMVLNDPQRSKTFDARQTFLDDWIVRRRSMHQECKPAEEGWKPRLVALAKDRLEARRVGAETTAWYRDMVGEPNTEGWQATVDRIADMDRIMRDRGGHLIVALWPLFVDLDGSYPFMETHRTISAALAARGIRFHDTLQGFKGQDAEALWVHPGDRHPNHVAHGVFAKEVLPALQAALRVPRSAQSP